MQPGRYDALITEAIAAQCLAVVAEGLVVGDSEVPVAQTDVFMVTLNKNEADYSPTTLYRDYAISQELFHWESQSGTSVQSATGRRYLEQRANGTNVLIFVRERKKQDGATMPYVCLGLADYVQHTGDRPIAVTYKLRQPMPADVFLEAKAVAG